MTDKSAVQQIIGSLMQHPQLLSEVDKYSLGLADFSNRFERYLFMAIKQLYCNGATNIQPIDIANCLEMDIVAKKIFEQNKGVEYLQDVYDFSNWENFSYYYQKLKKINLLRDYKKEGFDISDFYCEDLTRPNAEEINARFEELTIRDICDAIKRKYIKLESEYSQTDELEEERAAAGIRDFIKHMNEHVEMGAPLQGRMYSKIFSGAQKQALTIRSGCSGLGKALPNSTRIPTPNGWRKVEEIQVGDYLFDAFGKPTKVLNVYPQGEKEVWEITFKDGRKAKCCNEHLWSYWTKIQKPSAFTKRRFVTKTLKDIINEKKDKYDILIPQQYAVQYNEQEHFVPPYIMGLMLGGGSFRQHQTNKSFQYSSEDNYLPQIIAEKMGWILKKSSQNNFSWYFSTKEKQDYQNEKINVWVEDVLIEHPDLVNADSKTKFIPRKYIEDSVENRISILNGLLDSDGHVDKKGRVSYCTISEQLRDDVVEIAKSLGYKTHITVDTHKSTNTLYIVSIQGRPADKVKLFLLPRKKEIIEKWYNTNNRKETNEYNPVIDIQNLGYQEEMTCFYVDNDEHLFLMNDFIVTHNTRQAVGDACYLAYPIRYNSTQRKWEQSGNCEKVLFIMTEQTMAQIRRMIIAYLSDINESRFKLGNFSPEEQKILDQAADIMEKYADNLILIKMPNPTIELVKTIVRENCLTKDIGYVFYDYVFIGPALLNEFRGFSLRNDEVLLMFTTALKDLAVELNVAMFTSTQVNASADDHKNIRNEASLAGGRSTINKADNGAIMARPSSEELESLEQITNKYGIPNCVTDIFKCRSGEWTQVRIWSQVDLGRMKKRDLFVTDARLEAIPDFFSDDGMDICEVYEWDDETQQDIMKTVLELNGENLNKSTGEVVERNGIGGLSEYC